MRPRGNGLTASFADTRLITRDLLRRHHCFVFQRRDTVVGPVSAGAKHLGQLNQIGSWDARQSRDPCAAQSVR